MSQVLDHHCLRKDATVRNKWWIVVAALFLLTLSGNSAFSKDKNDGKGQGKNKTAGDKVRKMLPPSEPIFVQQEIVLVRGWYRDGGKGLPPGLAKRDRLPPGLEKKLVRGGKLPPGLQKKIQPLPIEIERQLHVLPTGYRRVFIAGNAVIMDPRTSLIYDVVRLAIP